MVDALSGGLTLVETRVLDLFAFSANVNLVISGSLIGDQWVLRDLGFQPVVVKRLPPRHMGQQLPLAPAACVPAPRRVLSGEEKLSWAERVRAPPPARPEEMVVDDVAPAAPWDAWVEGLACSSGGRASPEGGELQGGGSSNSGGPGGRGARVRGRGAGDHSSSLAWSG